MRVTQITHTKLDVDFLVMLRAYLSIPESSKIEVKVGGANFTFSEVAVIITNK